MNTIAHRVQLSGGIEIPQYIFGTGGIFKPDSIHHALASGYRALDTAQMYKNEREVGEAVRSFPGGVKRSELFVITKIQNAEGDIMAGIRESVDKIGLDGYVDLFLIHNPLAGPDGRRAQWQALEQAKKEGLTRAIGVSNFSIKHLEELKGYAVETPVINQIELHPWNSEPELAAYCKQHGIALQAYAPAVRAKKADDPVLLSIAKQVDRSWNRVLLRWSWQRGFLVTCKSDTPSRITDNVQIFDFALSEMQMSALDALDCGFRVTPNTMGSP